jgi:hypothetical protein
VKRAQAIPFTLTLTLTLTLGLAACVGTTGGEVVSFGAQLAGPSEVTAHRMAFTSGRGLAVTLTKATLRVGAVYMNRSKPIPVAQEKSCIATGTYVGEVLGGVEADLLSGAPVRFARGGRGTNDPAVAGELWLSGGDIDALEDKTVIASVEGEVALPAGTKPFRGSVTFGSNRRSQAVDPARPGADAPCKQRVVSPVAIDVTLAQGGLLTVRVDPRAWFALVPFEDLREEGGVLVFDDADTNASSVGLADGLRAPQGVYRFEWTSR